jgi:uncharacterized membrane protein YkoI
MNMKRVLYSGSAAGVLVLVYALSSLILGSAYAQSQPPQPPAMQTGDNTQGQQSQSIDTVLQAIRARFPDALIHEVELMSAGKAYEVRVDAGSGRLLQVEDEDLDDADAHDRGAATRPEPKISPDLVAQAALVHFPGASVRKVELEDEDGLVIYEVELLADGQEHELEVDANSGAVLRGEAEERDEASESGND